MQTSILTPQNIFFQIVRYEIPAFQRPYIWTQEQQWEPLWEDVSDMADSIVESGQTSAHFMGAIVLQQRPNPTNAIQSRIVVDGQQRLTTLQLLIDAIQEVCEQREHKGPAERLAPLVYTQEAFWGGNPDLAFKVWPTIYDQPAFRHAMQNDLPSDEYKNSRIVAAHNYFKNKTEQWLEVFREEDGQQEKAASALERVVTNHLELVVIDLGLADDPHVIFETLNARGTPLLPSDMIKNQILHIAGVGAEYDEGNQSDEIEQLWGFSDDWWRREIGRGHQRRPRIDVYLNNWLTLRNRSETKAHTEFAAFGKYAKNSIENGTAIQEIAEDIGRLGGIYRDIDQSRINLIEPFLYRRRVMGIGAVIPTLLWLLSSEVPESQLLRSITFLESYMIRRMACGMSARSYGQLFLGLTNELENAGPGLAGNTVVRFLNQQTAYANLWPDDQTLLDTFLTKPMYGSLAQGRLNLILQGIEGELRTAMSETQAVPRNLHIEHVMPQGWMAHWNLPDEVEDREIAVARRNRMIHSMGNLTLVSQRLNTALSNAPWEQKRVTLDKHAVLHLNKDLTLNAPPMWDESAIVERGKRLHEAAIKVWPHANSAMQ